MTQEKMNKIFEGELGMQCNSLFSTPDDEVFIRRSEAVNHCEEKALNKNEIIEWFEEYSGSDINPVIRKVDFDNPPNPPTPAQCFNSIEAAISQLMLDHPEFSEEYTTGWDMICTLDYIKNEYNKAN